MCRVHGIECPSCSDLHTVASSLSSMHCIVVEQGLPELHHRLRLNVAEEDIQMGLRKELFFEKILSSASFGQPRGN